MPASIVCRRVDETRPRRVPSRGAGFTAARAVRRVERTVIDETKVNV
jgi:hypothetical protein